MNLIPTPPLSSNFAQKLSPRELELLTLLNKGNCYKKSALLMGVEETTVKTLGARAYKKLGANNLQKALHQARNQHLI